MSKVRLWNDDNENAADADDVKWRISTHDILIEMIKV